MSAAPQIVSGRYIHTRICVISVTCICVCKCPVLAFYIVPVIGMFALGNPHPRISADHIWVGQSHAMRRRIEEVCATDCGELMDLSVLREQGANQFPMVAGCVVADIECN